MSKRTRENSACDKSEKITEDEERDLSRRKQQKPNILDLLSKQKKGQTAQCPICDQTILMSKMNHHLDSGCLATDGHGTNDTSKNTCNDACDEFLPSRYKYDRKVHNNSSMQEDARENKPTSTTSPYFGKKEGSQDYKVKRSKLKLKKKTLSFGQVHGHEKGKSSTDKDVSQSDESTSSQTDSVRLLKSDKIDSPIICCEVAKPAGDDSEQCSTTNTKSEVPVTTGSSDTQQCITVNDASTSKSSAQIKTAEFDSLFPVEFTNSGNITEKYQESSVMDRSTPVSSRHGVCSSFSVAMANEEVSKTTESSVSVIATPISSGYSSSNVTMASEKAFESPASTDNSTQSSSGHSSTDVAMETEEVHQTSQDGSAIQNRENHENSEVEDGPKQPYYLVNFLLVMNTVLDSDEDRGLFNEEDMTCINKFRTLPEEAQKLYVRLFQRKPTWLRVEKLDYPRIAADLKPVAKQLVTAGFLQTEHDLTDLEETLNLLQAPDLKNLAKSLRVSCSGLQRGQVIDSLMKHGRQQRTIFGGTASLILKRAKKALGSCVKLIRDVKAIFTRLVLLFSLKNVADEEDFYADGGQSLLSMLFLANYGRVVYPKYTVYRPTVLFRSRDEFLKFQVALQYEGDINTALSSNDFETALALYLDACKEYEPMKNDKDICSFDTSLPVFLRCFTTSWIYTRIQSLGVEIYQKLRRYREAVDKLRELLKQDVYCAHARGRWWDRLALNLDQHLKKPSESLDSIKAALADSHVRTGHRLALEQRVFKICESPSNLKLKKRLSEFSLTKIKETPKLVISGNIRQNDVVNERFYVIQKLSKNSGDGETEEILTSRVEEFVLNYYKENGYNEGIHGEGSTFTTLIGLLVWDILFADNIPDVFRYPFQTGPLDFRGDDFYVNRRDKIEARLDLIEKSSEESLHGMVDETWNTHEGEQCCMINWELFNDLDHVKGFISCMGGHILSAIGRRILKDHRHCRGGVPDLVVWNTETKTCRIVEVKGPNDRLAHKQILWIDFLNSIGATAEVCHVTAVGGKKLRASID
ncbi:fanconi-associated nuclease 1-like [Ptychodera flava]|uniref:fanconi-associated nuclease 1-like n=1 Tax=Ptychodera flava TaxID=63121 RepID=UPI00396A4BC8